MATSPVAPDEGGMHAQEKWGPMDDVTSEHVGAGGESDRDREQTNGPPLNGDEAVNDGAKPIDDDYRSEKSANVTGSKSGTIYREKQVKPNKVYIGGLPEHTRQEDLQNCFGKLGRIVNIELKLGYGFVEFDSREAAEESVSKYHEGYFMGNKIRVELSHGGGRTAKYPGDPGACFKCGQMGHWARECPNHVVQVGAGPHRKTHTPQGPDSSLLDRIGNTSRDQPPPPPHRDYPPYRDDYGSSRYPSTREPRYGGYDYPPPSSREIRRPPSPPRDYRDYPPARSREYDDYRMRGPPPPPPRGYYPPDGPPSYPPRSYDAPPPPRDVYDRGMDKRGPPPDRYGPYPPTGGRPRTPPGPPPGPPRGRDDYDRPPPRDFQGPPEYRGRPVTPPLPPPPSRYSDYPPRGGPVDPPPPRYRRRSQSPPARSGGAGYRAPGYVNEPGPDPAGYTSGGPAYGSSAAGFSGNGYPGGSSAPPPRSGSTRDRDFQSRNGGEPGGGYSRRP
ncbi:RNA-binding domain-containing protein [Rickenella mellea]|uniref:RNA-binding domain-containing protein n=1 Tax=Rickenella mellea TaxID=50990 RepID=A0A4Y7QNK7_9AGAM|nr:RNA-binding domain-containing protein [Rickenella mellea]